MEALGKYILIKPEKVEEQKSASGLFATAADSQKMRWQNAETIEVGDEVNPKIKKGQRIAYDSAAGHDIKIGEELFRMISERDVALIL